MTPDFTLIWPLSCLKDRVHLFPGAARPGAASGVRETGARGDGPESDLVVGYH